MFSDLLGQMRSDVAVRGSHKWPENLDVIYRNTMCCISLRSLACLWSKMPMFQREVMKEGEEPLPLACQYLILMIWRPCDLTLVMISLLDQNANILELGCPFFSHFMKLNQKPLSWKYWHFEVSEDIMTRFKSQGLHIIKIECQNASGSSPCPSLIPTL